MSRNSCFRGPFDKQHGKRAQTLLKSASQHLYHIHRSLHKKFSSQKSLLLTCKMLGLLVNTFAAHERYLDLHRDNSRIPIQMLLSEKQKWFCQFFPAFLKTRFNFEHFDRKDDPHTLCISEITYSENVVREMYKKFCFRDLSRTNMVNVLKHCWNLPHSTFIIFTGHCQENFVGKSLSYWHGKSWDCFLTHCTPMKSILLIIGTI